MSLTKRTWTDLVGAHTLTFTGSVSGATTKLTIVFQASGAIYGLKSSINVYVNGTKQSCTWTTNKTESLVGTTYKTKMTSSQMTINKPFFTLKLTDSADGDVIYEATFSFYEIEKAPTAATCSGGVMDGTTKSTYRMVQRCPECHDRQGKCCLSGTLRRSGLLLNLHYDHGVCPCQRETNTDGDHTCG